MILALIIATLVAVVFALHALNDYEHEIGGLWLVVAVVLGLVTWHCANTPERVAARYAEQQADAAAASQAASPHVIATKDGCKVYQFRADQREHFFTSCPDSRTDTESTYEVSHGKTSTTEIEHITSEVHP